MTILTTISEIEYSGSMGQDTFAYTFRVDKITDMNVHLDGVPVAQGDFTMTGLGTASGGNVVLDTPLVIAATVLLFRDVPPTQEVDYQPFDAFPAETHEMALDKLTMIVQEADTSVQRSLRYPPGDTASPVLEDKVARASKFLAFDVNGEPVSLAGTGGGDPNAVQKPAGAVVAGNLMEFDLGKNAVDSGDSIATLTAAIIAAAKVDIYAELYPVGSFKIGVDPTPIVGGTWVQLAEGTFLMNTIAGVDAAGGENTTNLVNGQMPTHSHGGGDHFHDVDGQSGAASGPIVGSVNLATTPTFSFITRNSGNIINSQGNADDIENRPLYKGVAVWERTA